MFFQGHFRKKICQMEEKLLNRLLLSYKLYTRLIAYQGINCYYP